MIDLDSCEFAAVARLVGRRTGLAFGPNLKELVEAGIRRCMVAAGVRRVDDYLALIERDDGAFDELVAAVTVGESYFFRDLNQFQFIRRRILPTWLARGGSGQRVRIWSAGCATGEEAYSLAMAVRAYGLPAQVDVLGSDISRPALAKAREAAYSRWSLRGLDEATIQRHFRSRDGRYWLDETFREAVSFSHLNLAEATYPSVLNGIWNMDLILCRNVLIYFDRETIQQVGRRLLASLAPGGWLILGASDPPLGGLSALDVEVTREGVFYRRRGDCPGGALETPGPSVGRRAPQPEGGVRLVERVLRDPVQEDSVPASNIASPKANEGAGPLAGADWATRPEDAELAIRACANRDGPEAAAKLSAAAVRRHRLRPGLHFLHGMILMELGRLEEAVLAMRRVLYLDDRIALAHYLLGSALARRGDRQGAVRAYQAAAALARECPPDEEVLLGDGTRAGWLLRAARVEAERLREGHSDAATLG